MTGTGADWTPANNGTGIFVRFWGVRGSLPAPGPATVRYGGNTLCVELRCGPHLLILDAGSGMRELGNVLAAAGVPVEADVLITHTHLDHVCGLPFFAPLYDPQSRVRIWGGHLAPDRIADALALSFRAPLMPDMDAGFRAGVAFHDFVPADELEPHPELVVATTTLRHPGNAVGYRVAWCGASVCYITDTEHPAEGIDENLQRFVAGTDVMIYDASYTEAEYACRKGWGHSTWQAGALLAEAAAVKRLVLFHHDPNHDDDTMDEIARAAAHHRPGTLVAKEGMTMLVGAAAGTSTVAAQAGSVFIAASQPADPHAA